MIKRKNVNTKTDANGFAALGVQGTNNALFAVCIDPESNYYLDYIFKNRYNIYYAKVRERETNTIPPKETTINLIVGYV